MAVADYLETKERIVPSTGNSQKFKVRDVTSKLQDAYSSLESNTLNTPQAISQNLHDLYVLEGRIGKIKSLKAYQKAGETYFISRELGIAYRASALDDLVWNVKHSIKYHKKQLENQAATVLKSKAHKSNLKEIKDKYSRLSELYSALNNVAQEDSELQNLVGRVLKQKEIYASEEAKFRAIYNNTVSKYNGPWEIVKGRQGNLFNGLEHVEEADNLEFGYFTAKPANPKQLSFDFKVPAAISETLEEKVRPQVKGILSRTLDKIENSIADYFDIPETTKDSSGFFMPISPIQLVPGYSSGRKPKEQLDPNTYAPSGRRWDEKPKRSIFSKAKSFFTGYKFKLPPDQMQGGPETFIGENGILYRNGVQIQIPYMTLAEFANGLSKEMPFRITHDVLIGRPKASYDHMSAFRKLWRRIKRI